MSDPDGDAGFFTGSTAEQEATGADGRDGHQDEYDDDDDDLDHDDYLNPTAGTGGRDFRKRRQWPTQIASGLLDLVIVVGADERVVYVSAGIESITGGIQADRLVGRGLMEMLHPDDAFAFLRVFNQAIASGHSARTYVRLRAAGDHFDTQEQRHRNDEDLNQETHRQDHDVDVGEPEPEHHDDEPVRTVDPEDRLGEQSDRPNRDDEHDDEMYARNPVLEAIVHPQSGPENGSDASFIAFRPTSVGKIAVVDSFLEHQMRNFELEAAVAKLQHELAAVDGDDGTGGLEQVVADGPVDSPDGDEDGDVDVDDEIEGDADDGDDDERQSTSGSAGSPEADECPLELLGYPIEDVDSVLDLVEQDEYGLLGIDPDDDEADDLCFPLQSLLSSPASVYISGDEWSEDDIEANAAFESDYSDFDYRNGEDGDDEVTDELPSDPHEQVGPNVNDDVGLDRNSTISSSELFSHEQPMDDAGVQMYNPSAGPAVDRHPDHGFRQAFRHHQTRPGGMVDGRIDQDGSDQPGTNDDTMGLYLDSDADEHAGPMGSTSGLDASSGGPDTDAGLDRALNVATVNATVNTVVTGSTTAAIGTGGGEHGLGPGVGIGLSAGLGLGLGDVPGSGMSGASSRTGTAPATSSDVDDTTSPGSVPSIRVSTVTATSSGAEDRSGSSVGSATGSTAGMSSGTVSCASLSSDRHSGLPVAASGSSFGLSPGASSSSSAAAVVAAAAAAAASASSRGRQRVCHDCGSLNSPEWRRGPSGPKTLCNACGLRWAKMQRKAAG